MDAVGGQTQVNVSFDRITQVYSEEFRQHGDSAQGVCWRNEELQHLRFDTFAQVVAPGVLNFSALDWGCGTGAFVPWLERLGVGEYVGVEINPFTRAVAQEKYPHHTFVTEIPDRKFDYVFVCGSFSFCGDNSLEQWEAWVKKQIQVLWEHTNVCLAINFLVPNPPDFKEPEIWYPSSYDTVWSWFNAPKKRMLTNYWKHEWMVQAYR